MDEYSNREIDVKFEGVHDKLDLILSQTTKTNGKVADIQKWRERWNGASYVLMTLVIPIIAWVLWSIVNLPSTIKNTIDSTLSTYNITLK